MQIILVSRHLKAARTITIMPRHLLAVLAVGVALVFSTSALFSWLSVHLRLPVVESMLQSLYGPESRKTQDYVSNNLKLMAGRLGELQGKVLQLDQLGERLSLLAGQREPAKSHQSDNARLKLRCRRRFKSRRPRRDWDIGRRLDEGRHRVA